MFLNNTSYEVALGVCIIVVSLSRYFTLFLAVPSVILNLAVSSRTNASMTVTWDAPSVGGVTGYNVTLQGGDTLQTESVTEPTTSVEFRGLKAGSVYTVGIVTVLGELRSTTVNKEFYTGA